MDIFRIVTLFVLVLFTGSLAFVVYQLPYRADDEAANINQTDKNMTIVVQTPQVQKYYSPKPLLRSYISHLTASNVSIHKPIIVALKRGNEKVFQMQMTIEQKKGNPVVSIWLSQ